MQAIASLALAWDPVSPGALVDKIGDMVIVDQSVIIILSFENLTLVRDTLALITEGLKIVKDRLNLRENGVTHTRLWIKLN